MHPHEYYNTTNFPILVAHHGNWDIYRNDKGWCAAIPVVEGCRASHFGDMNYLKHVPDLVYIEAAPSPRDGTTAVVPSVIFPLNQDGPSI